MRKYLIPLLGLFLCWTRPASAAFSCTYTSNTTHSVTSPATAVVTFTPALHDALFVVGAAWNNAGSAPTIAVSDNNLNSYGTVAGASTTRGGGVSWSTATLFDELNVNATSTTITVTGTFGAGGAPNDIDVDILVADCSGVATSSALDQANVNTSSSSANINTGNITTLANSEYVLTYVFNQSDNSAMTVAASFTKQTGQNNADGTASALGDQFPLNIGTYSATWTPGSGNGSMISGIASFKPAAAGGGGGGMGGKAGMGAKAGLG